MPIQPKQPTAKGPAEWFTGDVWIDGIARGEEPSRVRVNAVRFTPAARTAWHAHAEQAKSPQCLPPRVQPVGVVDRNLFGQVLLERHRRLPGERFGSP